MFSWIYEIYEKKKKKKNSVVWKIIFLELPYPPEFMKLIFFFFNKLQLMKLITIASTLHSKLGATKTTLGEICDCYLTI